MKMGMRSGGIAIAMTIALGVAISGCAGTAKTVTEASPAGEDQAATSVSTAQATSAPSTTPASSAAISPAPAKPQIYHGTGQQELGAITVPADSTISWNCPSCGNTNFIINNANSDDHDITTNGLDQTSGVDTLPAGVYHTVVVDTTGGPWTVAIGTTAPPAASSVPQPSGSADTQPASSDSGSAMQCDANISVSQGECHFAENTFYEYWKHQGAQTLSVYSPADQTSFTVTCSTDAEITCSADQGTSVQFSQSSIDAYTQSQANSYAASHNIGP